MLPTQVNWKSGGRVLSLALLGGMTLSPVAGADNTAYAQPLPHEWLSIEGSWLCWTITTASPSSIVVAPPAPGSNSLRANGQAAGGDDSGKTVIHCTRSWHRDSAGYLVSSVPDWVPAAGEGALAAEDAARPFPRVRRTFTVPAPKPAPKPAARPLAAPVAARPAAVSPPAGGYNPWAPVPGHPGYAMSDFAGDPNAGYFGYCTWYAWYRNQGEPLMKLGMASQWAANAPRYGLRTGTTPVVGATAVFQPGVEGAGSGGHVAHVEQVLGGGWFIVSEMNFGLNGGGWGRIDWRYAYVAPGVAFIY